MTGVIICEPSALYNILNQYTHVSKLTEINYLCLIGKYMLDVRIIVYVIKANGAGHISATLLSVLIKLRL